VARRRGEDPLKHIYGADALLHAHRVSSGLFLATDKVDCQGDSERCSFALVLSVRQEQVAGSKVVRNSRILARFRLTPSLLWRDRGFA
jgi:hypothetical protein